MWIGIAVWNLVIGWNSRASYVKEKAKEVVVWKLNAVVDMWHVNYYYYKLFPFAHTIYFTITTYKTVFIGLSWFQCSMLDVSALFSK